MQPPLAIIPVPATPLTPLAYNTSFPLAIRSAQAATSPSLGAPPAPVLWHAMQAAL